MSREKMKVREGREGRVRERVFMYLLSMSMGQQPSRRVFTVSTIPCLVPILLRAVPCTHHTHTHTHHHNQTGRVGSYSHL